MIIYWALFLIPVFAALGPIKVRSDLQATFVVVYGVFAVAVIGFRYEVGCDWDAYLGIYERVASSPLSEAILITDVSYALLNWLAANVAGWGVEAVNFICAIFFVNGLVRFSLAQPLPWLSLCLAAPYMTIVVAMGYTRQAAAIGFVLWAMANWRRGVGGFVGYCLLILCAATMHKSALMMLPFSILLVSARFIVRLMVAVPLIAVVAAGLALDLLEAQLTAYLDGELQSGGALLRVGMNAIPAAFLLSARNYFRDEPDQNLWWWLAVMSLGSLLFVDTFSTLVDRLALYLAPIQMVVYTKLLTRVSGAWRGFWGSVLLGFYAISLAVWFSESTYAVCWVPYKWDL